MSDLTTKLFEFFDNGDIPLMLCHTAEKTNTNGDTIMMSDLPQFKRFVTRYMAAKAELSQIQKQLREQNDLYLDMFDWLSKNHGEILSQYLLHKSAWVDKPEEEKCETCGREK